MWMSLPRPYLFTVKRELLRSSAVYQCLYYTTRWDLVSLERVPDTGPGTVRRQWSHLVTPNV